MTQSHKLFSGAIKESNDGWPKTVTRLDGSTKGYNSRKEWARDARARFAAWESQKSAGKK